MSGNDEQSNASSFMQPKSRKLVNAVFTAIAVAAIASFVVTRAFFATFPQFAPPEQSQTEGRVLQAFPEVKRSAILSGDLQSQLDSYISDHVLFRETLITINGYLNYKVLGKSQSPNTIIGKDGWLFGSAGIREFTGKNLFTDAELAKIAINLEALHDKLNEQGRELIIFIPPDKESIYGERYLPDGSYKMADRSRLDQTIQYLRKNTNINIICPKSELLEMSEMLYPDTVYLKTDSHWNYLGGHIGVTSLFNDIPKLDGYTQYSRKGGDLARMMGLKDLLGDVDYSVNGFDAEWRNPNPSYFAKTLEYSNPDAPDQRSVLIMRDSFGAAMVPFIKDHFAKTQLLHWDEYSLDAVWNHPSDVVVLERIERSMDRMLIDQFN